MKRNLAILAAIIGLALFLGGRFIFFTVSEMEQAIITEFGQPLGTAITKAGLHFKLPWRTAHFLPNRILRWDGNLREIVTKDKKYIFVDTTARWRIVDPLKFFVSVRNETGAYARLDGIIDSVVRNNITEHLLLELVRTNKQPLSTVDDEAADFEAVKEEEVAMTYGRDEIMAQVHKEIHDETLKVFGIEVLDVKIKQVNYIEEVRKKVYERMISERNRIAEKYRSEGQGEKAKILGAMEKELKRIDSEAYRKAKEIEGTADAESTKIYAEAFNRDPEFYAFYRTLQAYRSMQPHQIKLLMSSNNELFRYLDKSSR